VNLFSGIKGPFLLEGKEYRPAGLQDYCSAMSSDESLPPWKQELYSFIALFLDPAKGEILQKSSGSTGDPKSFILSREAMAVSAERTLRFFDLRRGQRALLCLPAHYIAGKLMVVRALLGGLDLVLTEPSSRPLQGMEEAVDFAAMVPLQIEESLNQADPLGMISKLIVGGGEVHPETMKSLSRLSLPEVYETFGMTETYTHFALRRINGPSPDTSFRVLEGVHVDLDPRACLLVEIPGITSAPLITNDLVEINSTGDAFSWLGRFDHLINSGGIKIIPELLEEQVKEILGLECLVLSEPDRKLGNSLVLLLVHEGEEPPLETWQKLLRKSLSTYEFPRRIITVNTLPRNKSMKPDRTSARKLLL
jgi:O-succinylbenzoic acid--CoA ligase